MIDFNVYWKTTDESEMRQKTESVLEQLNWEKKIILNRSSYGGICAFGLKKNCVEVIINDEGNKQSNNNHALDFIDALCDFKEEVLSVELFYNGEETEYLFYNYALPVPCDDADIENLIEKYVRIELKKTDKIMKTKRKIAIRKNLLVVTILLVSFSSLFSQEGYQDEVHVKGGSIIKGTIIEHVPYEFVRIKSVEGNIFLLNIEKVEKIIYESFVQRYNHYEGYQGSIEIGYGFGVGNYGIDNFRLNFINGYKFRTHSFIGLGIGLRAYSEYGIKSTIVPVFAHFRGGFGKGSVSPYLSTGIGYSFEASNNFHGLGFILNPAIGISFKISERNTINVGVRYESQYLKVYTPINYEYIAETTECIESISINMEITF